MTLAINELHILDMRFSDHVSDSEFEHWLAQIQHYLDTEKSFVLIMQTEPNTHFPSQYRDIQAQWYKRYKQDFYRYCLGLARIAQDETDRIRLNTPALEKAWRVPYFVSLTKDDALHWAMQRYL